MNELIDLVNTYENRSIHTYTYRSEKHPTRISSIAFKFHSKQNNKYLTFHAESELGMNKLKRLDGIVTLKSLVDFISNAPGLVDIQTISDSLEAYQVYLKTSDEYVSQMLQRKNSDFGPRPIESYELLRKWFDEILDFKTLDFKNNQINASELPVNLFTKSLIEEELQFIQKLISKDLSVFDTLDSRIELKAFENHLIGKLKQMDEVKVYTNLGVTELRSKYLNALKESKQKSRPKSSWTKRETVGFLHALDADLDWADKSAIGAIISNLSWAQLNKSSNEPLTYEEYQVILDRLNSMITKVKKDQNSTIKKA